MPKWNDGLVDAFPIPLDHQLNLLNLKDKPHTEPEYEPSSPFPFFSLPAEIRNRIYNLVLFTKPSYRLASGRRHSRLSLLLASRRLHLECSYSLYTTHKFLIFPIQLFNALPTIQELPLHYRLLVTNLEMVVGPSWTNPPKSWRMTKSLSKCLGQLKNVQTLNVFVDFDPSHPAFTRYRISYEFYTDFCGDLLGDVLEAMPQLRYVQIDGNNGVDVHGPLVTRLREEALSEDKIVGWGKQADWALKFDETRLKEYENLESVRLIEVAPFEKRTEERSAVASSSKPVKASGQPSKVRTRVKKKKDDHMVKLY